MLRKSGLSLLLCLFTQASVALTGYHVELIVYSHLNQSGFNNETWSTADNSAAANYGLSLSSLKTNLNLHSVTANQFTLSDFAKKLSNSPNYKILLHTAWYESLAQLDKSTTIQLNGGDRYTNGLSEMNGHVTVRMNHYFDVNFNLTFAIPNAVLEKLTQDKKYLNQPFVFIPLKESRRTKSKELNYVDHPLYGVLFKITPV